MMAKVQVGFNRTLEDELGESTVFAPASSRLIHPAITPGQQLWLHTVYDDGWALCEDQNQNRGVVPTTSLVPWSDDDPNHLSGMSRCAQCIEITRPELTLPGPTPVARSPTLLSADRVCTPTLRPAPPTSANRNRPYPSSPSSARPSASEEAATCSATRLYYTIVDAHAHKYLYFRRLCD